MTCGPLRPTGSRIDCVTPAASVRREDCQLHRLRDCCECSFESIHVELQLFGYEVVPFHAENLNRGTSFMGSFLINFLLGACRHRHQSRPFTLNNKTYTVCLDCGKEIGYSLANMQPQ
jgi:hypothetical protein